MTKVMSMREAVSRFVPDGSSVALGCALEPAIPFSAGHELIRQRRRDLTLIGPISDILFDQLIGAGCVATVVADALVDGDVIGGAPNATIVPAPKTCAVVVEAGAAHPSPLQDRYGRDHDFFHEYHAATRTLQGFESWLREWVTDVPDREAYVRKLGARWRALREAGAATTSPRP